MKRGSTERREGRRSKPNAGRACRAEPSRSDAISDCRCLRPSVHTMVVAKSPCTLQALQALHAVHSSAGRPRRISSTHLHLPRCLVAPRSGRAAGLLASSASWN